MRIALLKPFRARIAAFTLVELLAVIVIIAILLAILFPSIMKVAASAKSVKCIANLRQFGLGIPAYAADHDGVIYPACPNGTWYWRGPSRTLGTSQGDAAAFAPYVGDVGGIWKIGGIFSCPMISLEFPGHFLNPPNQPYGAIGYTMNTEVYRGNARLVKFGDHLSEVIVLMDGAGYGLDMYLSLAPLKKAARHNAGYNTLFLDGHVGHLQPSEVKNDQTGYQPLAGRLKGR
jgi:prepilin-type processing-associated H-X9-DG protein/prepilin-type N-terminal cleavage/methylation domain-containing protein